MKTYARIQAGAVFELFSTALPIAEVFNLADPTQSWVDITSVSPAPGVGWSYNGTAFSQPPAPTAPTLAQQAQIALANGCQIASTSTPALNGTYPIDPAAQSKIQATALYIQVNGKFPAGKTALPWADASGAIHIFASTAEFTAFATAIGDYVTELEMVMLGQSSSLPAQPVTIA